MRMVGPNCLGVVNTDPEQGASLPPDTEFAIANVRKFAEAQLATILPLEVETLPGVHLGHRGAGEQPAGRPRPAAAPRSCRSRRTGRP